MSDLPIGQNVRRLREASGRTRDHLAFRAGISSSTLARLELLNHIPKHAIMERIADELGVPVADLYRAYRVSA